MISTGSWKDGEWNLRVEIWPSAMQVQFLAPSDQSKWHLTGVIVVGSIKHNFQSKRRNWWGSQFLFLKSVAPRHRFCFFIALFERRFLWTYISDLHAFVHVWMQCDCFCFHTDVLSPPLRCLSCWSLQGFSCRTPLSVRVCRAPQQPGVT